MNNLEINNKICKIWEDFFEYRKSSINQNILKRTPLLYSRIHFKECILFIGLNPSFSVSGFNSILNNNKLEAIAKLIKKEGLETLFNFTKLDDYKEYLLQIEDCARYQKNHRYFTRFNVLTEYLSSSINSYNFKWEHIDLLYIRETNQKKIQEIISESKNNKFIYEQIELTLKILYDINPKIIVITSALVPQLLFDIKILSKFDHNNGCWFIDKYPVFVTSMLSGQRALDNGSFELLKWNIKRILTII
ncbi:MAG TPA: hypothetical protein PKY81_07355 [bacterium]|nr:hypothetical protein [bacterium]